MTAVVILLTALTAAPISVNYRGTLGEALNEIATKGGINLIATGDLNVAAEVHFTGLTAEEALETLVKVHRLELHKEGKLWVVKPAGATVEAAEPAGVPAVPSVSAVWAVPPVAPLPPLAPLPPNATPDEIETHARAAEARAEAAQQHAEQLRERAEKIREAKEAVAEARAEEDEARIEEARAAVEEAKANAHEVKHGKKNVSTGPIVIADGAHVEDVVSYGGSVTLGDGVMADGDVVAFGGDVVLGDGTIVKGNATSFGGTIKKGDNALVKGEEISFGAGGFGVSSLAKTLPAVKEVRNTEERSGLAAFLINFATFFGLGFLLMMFAPNRMRNIEAEIKTEPVKSGLAGLLGLIGSVPLSVLLALTVIGIPVMVVMWLLGGLAMIMGMLALANTLGTRFPIARLRRTQAAVLAAGLLAIMLIGVIPVIGPLLIMASICVSFGAIIRTRVGQRSLGLPVPETSTIREVGA